MASVYLRLPNGTHRAFLSDAVPNIGEVVEVDQHLTTNGSGVWLRVIERRWKLAKASDPDAPIEVDVQVWLDTKEEK